MNPKLNITVMLGGPSAEREVSLRTGTAVAKALRSLGHEVHEVDPRDGSFVLPPKTDVVFLALHGTYGEDGTVQKQLDKLGVPYTGCDAEASRIAFDKVLTKQSCMQAGVPTAAFAVVSSAQAPLPAGLPPPLVVKPSRQGSSVGLQFVERAEDWPKAVAESLKFDTEVLVEEKINGRETTVGILGGKVLPVVEVRPKAGAYDYKTKYTAGATEYFCPADFDEATTKRIQTAAIGAFRAVGGRDYSRVDVMVRPDGSPVVLEVNTLPGMTETSLLPKAAAAAGINYEQLCQRMIELALKRK
ncbi:MAG TPA: D-alanine--D-alanine ligase [Candidatus Sulfotelmatobacter sp.]|jgi:D-alanine-D-alanine ligase|nr:D-alanine--D-alanine ligase [Candidatus Sulfotelmatobacter sp.]